MEYLDGLGTGVPLDLWVQALRLPEGVEILRLAHRRVRGDLANLMADRSGQPTQATHLMRAALVLAVLDGLDLQATIDRKALPDPALLREAVLRMIWALDPTHG